MFISSQLVNTNGYRFGILSFKIKNHALRYINSCSDFPDFGHSCASCRKYPWVYKLFVTDTSRHSSVEMRPGLVLPSFSLIGSFWQPWQNKAAQKTMKPLTASHPCKAVRGENQRSDELLMWEMTTPHGPWEWRKPKRWQFVPSPQTGGQYTAETAAHAQVSSILQRAKPKVKPQCVKSRPPAWT